LILSRTGRLRFAAPVYGNSIAADKAKRRAAMEQDATATACSIRPGRLERTCINEPCLLFLRCFLLFVVQNAQCGKWYDRR